MVDHPHHEDDEDENENRVRDLLSGAVHRLALLRRESTTAAERVGMEGVP
jgi:hypothetical protein